MYQNPPASGQQWNQAQWNSGHQQHHQMSQAQGRQPTQHSSQAPSNQGPPKDYSQQWQEYWRQMESMQHPHAQPQPYNQHGPVSFKAFFSSFVYFAFCISLDFQMMSNTQAQSSEQQWRDYYGSSQYQNYQTHYHQDPGLNYPPQIAHYTSFHAPSPHYTQSQGDLGLELGIFSYDSASLQSQEISPLATSRYTPQSQC